MVKHMVEFIMDIYAFEDDPNVRMLMNKVNGVYSTVPWRRTVSIEDTQNHLTNSMAGMMPEGSSPGMMNWDVGTGYPLGAKTENVVNQGE